MAKRRLRKTIETPPGFPTIRDWFRENNDRLSTLECVVTTGAGRQVRLFCSYSIPIAFQVVTEGYPSHFVWWTPAMGTYHRTKTLMKHSTIVRDTYGPRDVSDDIAWYDCGANLSEFQLRYRTAIESEHAFNRLMSAGENPA